MTGGWSLVTPSSVLDFSNRIVARERYWFEVLADGLDLGEPGAVKVIFSTLAADSDDERIVRHGNRQVPLQVRVRGEDQAAIAAGERALRLALSSAPQLELRYTPPDGVGAVTVFDVVNATFKYQPDDLAIERANGVWAKYAVTLTCEAFTRPVKPVTVALSYSGTAPTTLKDGTSAAGVTGDNGVDPARVLNLTTVTYSGETAIKGTPAIARDTGWSDPCDRYKFAGVALTAAHPYLAVDVALDSPLGFRLDSFSATAVASVPGLNPNPVGFQALANGYRRYYFVHTLAGTTVDITFSVYMQQVYNGGTPASYIGGVYSAAAAPAGGLLVAEVEGSYRAPVRLSIARAAVGNLGRTIVYADPAMLTYGYIPGVAATWPNAPKGTYTAIVPFAGIAGNVYTLTINGQSSTTSYSAAVGALVFEFDLGARRDGRLGTLTTAYAVNGAPAAVPAFYLFRHAPGEAALTYIPDVAYRYLFLDSPTLRNSIIGAWAGNAADGSDATSIGGSAVSLEDLTIAPPLQALWVETAAPAIDASATYWPRSHTFVPRRKAA